MTLEQSAQLRDTLHRAWSYAMALTLEAPTAELVLRRAWTRAVARGLEGDDAVVLALVREEAVARMGRSQGLDEPSLSEFSPRVGTLAERFAQLPPAQREAVFLHSAARLPDDVIAATMGVAPQAVRAWVARGLDALGRLASRVSRP